MKLQSALPPERTGEARELAKNAFAMGMTYNWTDVGMWAALKLAAWTLAAYVHGVVRAAGEGTRLIPGGAGF